jgi:hypothetical protein
MYVIFKIYYSIPYKKAKANIAYWKYYVGSSLYRERVDVVGEEVAKDIYIDNREWIIFEKHITFKEKLGCLFIPYNYINNI